MTALSPPSPKALLVWFDAHARSLPWRAPKGVSPDPYHVWVSEIMLQQTTAPAVIPYFKAFIRRFSSLSSLAAAPLEEVLRQWAGLGYYRRAANLHAAARLVCTDYGGRLPERYEDLLRLPGIGPYTARAIAAIAFNRPGVAIDGNVERVVSRLFALEKPLIEKAAHALVSFDRPGDYAQALMELGALLCTPRRPQCLLCPWRASCRARAAGKQEEFPRRAPKAAKPLRVGLVFWLQRPDGALLLRRRPPKGLLAGMMALPASPFKTLTRFPPHTRHAPASVKWTRIEGIVRHEFTHFRLHLALYAGRIKGREAKRLAGQWVQPDALDDEGLPSLMRKAVFQFRKNAASARSL